LLIGQSPPILGGGYFTFWRLFARQSGFTKILREIDNR
jgi:hypothetical protein